MITTTDNHQTLESKRRLADELNEILSAEARVGVDEPLAKKTTLRVGGPADFFVEPVCEDDLAALFRWRGEHRIPILFLGRGSNVLIKDRGFRGVVVQLSHPFFREISIEENRLTCGAGARLKAVAQEARNHELGGLEFLEGIPGAVGGALRMNAGAMGGEIFDVVEKVRFMDASGQVMERTKKEIAFGYRSCPFFEDHLALAAVLVGEADTREAIDRRMRESSRKRWASQPAAPSAGCMFQNPDSIPAGKLIEEMGFKGMRLGGVRVSEVHGNFIVNEGQGTAADVLALIDLIQRKALTERGIELKTEVRIAGE